MTPLAYSVKQTLEVTPLTRRTLYAAINSGELPCKKRGRRTFILAQDLRHFLEAQPPGRPSAGDAG